MIKIPQCNALTSVFQAEFPSIYAFAFWVPPRDPEAVGEQYATLKVYGELVAGGHFSPTLTQRLLISPMYLEAGCEVFYMGPAGCKLAVVRLGDELFQE